MKLFSVLSCQCGVVGDLLLVKDNVNLVLGRIKVEGLIVETVTVLQAEAVVNALVVAVTGLSHILQPTSARVLLLKLHISVGVVAG